VGIQNCSQLLWTIKWWWQNGGEKWHRVCGETREWRECGNGIVFREWQKMALRCGNDRNGIKGGRNGIVLEEWPELPKMGSRCENGRNGIVLREWQEWHHIVGIAGMAEKARHVIFHENDRNGIMIAGIEF